MDAGRRKDVVDIFVYYYFRMRREGSRETASPLLSKMIQRALFICMVVLLQWGMAHAEIKRTQVPIGDSPSIGPADAPITIIEFIDFQ